MDEINERIRAAARRYETSETSDSDVDRLWDDVVLEESSCRAGQPAPRARRRLFSTRTTLVAAAVLIGATGVAVAATVAYRGDDSNVNHAVNQLSDPNGVHATPKEYRTLQATTLVPPPGATGTIPDSKLVAKYKLAPIEASRVIADDPAVGRLVAVPTADGESTCILYAGNADCGLRFDQLGLNVQWTQRPEADPNHADSVSGIAADTVSRVEVQLEDGRYIEAKLVDNVFHWKAANSTDQAVAVRSTRSGTVRSETIGSPSFDQDPITIDKLSS